MSQSELEKWVKKNRRKNNVRFAVWFVMLAVLCFLLVDGLEKGVEGLSEAGKLVFIFAVGVMMVWLVISQRFLQIKRCTTMIKAECVGVRYERSLGYHPEFSYTWEGKTYIECPSRFASKRKMMQKYVVGQEYEILINPDVPQEMRVDRKIGFYDILMLVMGIIMLALPIYIAFFEN